MPPFVNNSLYKTWFSHLNIKEEISSISIVDFTTHRNADNLPITDEGNGEDAVLEEKKPAENPEPDIHPIQSQCNEMNLICCNICNNIIFNQAFMCHLKMRHLQEQYSSLDQHKERPEPTCGQECEQKIKVKKVTADKKKKMGDFKTNDSERNVRDNLDIMFDPGYKRKRRTKCGSKIKKQKIVNEHNQPQGAQNPDQRNPSAVRVENLKQDSSFHDENNVYLERLGDGSKLTSRKHIRKTKPDVKLKRQKIIEKLEYEQPQQFIKLEPRKIKEALSRIYKYQARAKGHLWIRNCGCMRLA